MFGQTRPPSGADENRSHRGDDALREVRSHGEEGCLFGAKADERFPDGVCWIKIEARTVPGLDSFVILPAGRPFGCVRFWDRYARF